MESINRVPASTGGKGAILTSASDGWQVVPGAAAASR